MTNDDLNLPQRLSWRDPDGFVIRHRGELLRAVVPGKAERVRALLREPWLLALVAEGAIPESEEWRGAVPDVGQPGPWLWLKHRALPFPVYPHEITALQLYDSADLTLRVAIAAAEAGWVLKDASAWNVLHSEGRPVFVDLLSFDRTDNLGRWIAYGQYVRHFLLPLLLYRKIGLTPPEVFLGNRDGVSPEQANRLLGVAHKLSLVALELVVLPTALAGRGSHLIAQQSRQGPRGKNPQLSRELLLGALRRLRRMLEGLRPPLEESKSASAWAGYEEGRQHYSDADLGVKREFVRQHVAQSRSMLDLGCNAGEFSLLAAECGATVVAADGDHPALSRLYSRIRGRPARVSPVMVSIGRPTPAVGWLNREIPSVMDRLAGQFDCLLVLGLLHHLIVGERMTLPMLVELLERCGASTVIIEWVDPTDPKFRQLSGLNSELYAHLNAAAFEVALRTRFSLAARLDLPCGTRVMYLWQR